MSELSLTRGETSLKNEFIHLNENLTSVDLTVEEPEEIVIAVPIWFQTNKVNREEKRKE